MTAEERFKWMLANALERNCVLEAHIEQLESKIAELEQQRELAEFAPLNGH